MQFAACAAGCVRAQHALGSSVPRRSCMGVRMLRACTHNIPFGSFDLATP